MRRCRPDGHEGVGFEGELARHAVDEIELTARMMKIAQLFRSDV
jgi:hypothetical protein